MSVPSTGPNGVAMRPSRAAGRGPAALTLVGLCAICLVFAFLLFDAYNDAGQNAERATDNIAALVEQDIARNIQLYELSMRAVAEGVNDPAIMRLPPAMKNRVLFDRSATAPGLGSMLAIDENGHIFASSLPDIDMNTQLADRDYFRVQKDATSDIGLYVSEPFQSRLRQGDWSVALSCRLSHPDGSFAGVVVGSISLSFFSGLFSKVAIGPRDTMSLFKTNGTLLMRMPYVPLGPNANGGGHELMHRIGATRAGNFESAALSDGVRRLYAYRRVGNLPLVINVGFSEKEIYAGWWRKVMVTSMSLAILCAFVLVLMQQLRAELARRTKAETALSALATTDALTGLANRRKFDQVLDLEWRRAERDASVLSLIMIDVDFFKSFNDAYGHQEGDRVLRAVAGQVRASSCRPADISARYGGEEFVTLLPHTDAMGANRVAERIRQAIIALQLSHVHSPHGVVTVSLGVASLKPRYAGRPSDLVKAADAALYVSKATGRNRSSASEAAPLPEARDATESLARFEGDPAAVETFANSA